jgi:hypothetical protein
MALKDARQCTAKSKHSGERCKNPARIGYNVCRMHGAGNRKTPGGRPISSGKYSKVLPARLAESYLEARQDSELLALRDEIALCDARLGDLLKRVDTGESGRLWRDLRAAWVALEMARESQDGDAMASALKLVGQLIQRGQADYAAWDEVHKTLDARRKLTESERKRLVELQAVVTAEQAMGLVARVLGIVREHVKDRETLALMSAEFAALMAVKPKMIEQVDDAE